jgi:hypothetical protein
MKELIPIMDMVQSLAVAVGIPAGDVNMRVSNVKRYLIKLPCYI